MGLLDVLNGMQNGPRGSSDPSANPSSGMSPLTMAILALLAYKAVKKMGGNQPGAIPADVPTSAPPTVPNSPGGAAGSILSGGLGDLLKQFQESGHSDTANSWVGPGPNKNISPGDLANALGAEQISTMMSQSGLSRDELLQGLSQHLPEVVNQLTPNGRLPTEHEASRLM